MGYHELIGKEKFYIAHAEHWTIFYSFEIVHVLFSLAIYNITV